MQKRMLRPKEAAEYIGVSISQFWEFVKSGAILGVKLGPKMTRFDVHDLDHYIESLKAQR